jgi:chaperonin cofactor prefoldin
MSAADVAAEALKLKEEGNVAYRAKDFEAALASYGRAIELDPKSDCAALCYSNRSAVFQAQKKYAKAEKDAQSWLALKPDCARGYVRLALSQRRQGKFDEALQTIADGLKVAPGDEELTKALSATEAAKQKKKSHAAAVLSALTAGQGKSKGGGGGGVSQEEMRTLQTLQQTLQALGDQRNDVVGQQQEVEMKIRSHVNSAARANMTLQELAAVPDDCTNYRSVGRMYLRSPMPETKEFLKTAIHQNNEKLKGLADRQEYLENQRKAMDSDIQKLADTLRRSS